ILLEATLAPGGESGDEPGEEPDFAAAVSDLRRARPYLFAPLSSTPPPPARASMGAGGPGGPGGAGGASVGLDDLDEALRLAADTGDRAALLRYLRLRRAV